ncbi:hypothetical protein Tco_1364167 [Tanacetum coccineum]
MHLTTLIPYPRFTKIIVDHILTEHPDISKRTNEPYHRVENDEDVKLIFNSRKRKGRGMMIPEWLLTEEMKQTKNYKLSRLSKDEHLMDKDIEKLVEGEEINADSELDLELAPTCMIYCDLELLEIITFSFSLQNHCESCYLVNLVTSGRTCSYFSFDLKAIE